MNHIQLVIRSSGYSVNKLARELGISQQAVAKWQRIPQDRASDVQRLLKLDDAQLLELMGVRAETKP